ncbi:hypothetical protein CIHG_04487 [Coccidioides immitis H538.4]|uniref:Uncharacterized protein n=1 Tax=Coccidioides immitis H538.4 TaxID=396776 RepID=A0A0J8UH04_COCIT|nr:hypothetical protein CIHG_04487 [Coccidioides immitis H538.4]
MDKLKGPVITVRRFARVTPGSEPNGGHRRAANASRRVEHKFHNTGRDGGDFRDTWNRVADLPWPAISIISIVPFGLEKLGGKVGGVEPMSRLPGTAVRPPQSHVVEGGCTELPSTSTHSHCHLYNIKLSNNALDLINFFFSVSTAKNGMSGYSVHASGGPKSLNDLTHNTFGH